MSALSPPDRSPQKPPVLPLRALIAWALAFVGVLWAAHTLVLLAYRYIKFDCPPHWPLSIYNPRGPHHFVEFAALFATIGVGAVALWRLPRMGYRWREVAGFGLLLVLLSNAIQGVPKGFYNPIAGGIHGEQYYHDALDVDSPLALMQKFHERQPTLRTHARTHPPGAVLLFWALHRLVHLPPAAIAVVIAIVSTLLTAAAFPRFAASLLVLDAPLIGYGTFLLLLLPAVQIYYCATLDGVVAALLLASVAAHGARHTVGNTVIAALFLTAASFLTFGVAWAIPVLLALDRVRFSWRQSLTRLGLTLLVPVLFYGLLRVTTGFDYLLALRTASHLENPDGFRLFSETASYFFTRLEDVSEIVVFFGPFLLALLVRGWGRIRFPWERSARITFLTAVGTLLFLFVTGAYHTGETARACVFLYPYLLLPVLAALRLAPENERTRIAALVLLQTILMQTWGNFFW